MRNNDVGTGSGISAFIPAVVEGVDAKLLVDSGAAVTLISQSLYEKINHKQCLIHCDMDNIVLKAAGDSILEVKAYVTVGFDIAGVTYTWTAFVVPISEDALLGYDFLYHFDCVLEARRGLKINGKFVNCELAGHVPDVNRVCLKSDTIIPARSEAVAHTCIPDQSLTDDIVIEPLSEGLRNDSLLVGACLVSSSSSMPVRIMNTSSEDINMCAGTTIGRAHEVCNVITINDDEVHEGNTAIRSCHVQADINSNVSTEPLHPIVDELYQRNSMDLNADEKKQLRDLLIKHDNAFAKSPSDLGRTSILKHKIETGNARPIRQPARRPPRAFEGEEEKIISEQLEAGIITPSKSPWASPLVYVKKKDGTTRPCVDYRKLNSVTEFDSFPLPRMDDCLDCLSGSTFFSTLDLQSGYWQVEVEEKDRPKTAFRTRSGLFEYNVMPFGLSNAPSTFERCMELVLKGLQWKTLLIYLDDVIICSPDFDTHIQRLDEVFSRLSEAGLKLKPSKCSLFQSEVLFLGHIVTPDGVKANPEKIKSVAEWSTPRNTNEIRSFLGLCSYYRRFIKDFSSIARPLNHLLESGVKFKWDENCELAFCTLKERLTSDNVMAYPMDGAKYILDTDASNWGIGATLSQVQWDSSTGQYHERPIAFASKSLTKAQRRYCVTRRELLAIVTFTNQFRHYLLGREFLIRTDHSALRWIMSFKEPTNQMARWLEILSQFNFKLEHRAGRNHLNADALSRIPCSPEACECYDGRSVLTSLPCGGCTFCQKQHASWSNFMELDDVSPTMTRRVTSACNDNESARGGSTRQRDDSATPSATLQGDVNEKDADESVKCRFSLRLAVGYAQFLIFLILGVMLKGVNIFGNLCKSLKEPVITNFVRPIVTRRQAAKGQEMLNNKKPSDTNKEPCVSDKYANADGKIGQQLLESLGFSVNNVSSLQRQDKDICTVLNWMNESQTRPRREKVQDKSPGVRNLWLLWEQLVLINGVLYKRWDETPTQSHLTLIVPKSLISTILEANHDFVLAGHLGFKKSFSRIRKNYYWYKMKDDVRNYIRACSVCGARKRPQTSPKAPLKNYQQGAPLDRVCMDILGPFPLSEAGNKYVLVVGDTFSKWIEAYSIPDQCSSTVAEKVVNEFISRFGTPFEIHTDQGRTFESSLFKEMCNTFKIHKTRTTSYHPQSNGFIERFNQTLVNMISAYVSNHQKDWDENINLLTAAYRSTVHSTTGFSPNYLMLGREVSTPLEVTLGLRPYTSS